MGEDRSASERSQGRRRVTVAEASEILGITAEAVRTRIKRGKLDSVKEPPDRTGTVYVLLQADQTRPNIDPTSQGQDQTIDQTELVETLREQVAYLQGVIAVRDQELALRAEEIRRRDTALEREQQLAAMFADRLQALEAPTTSSEARESDVSPGPTDELGEVREELGAEQARREMAESTLHEGMAEEQRRREEAERERDELRQELFARREQRESPQTVEEEPERQSPSRVPKGVKRAYRGRGEVCGVGYAEAERKEDDRGSRRRFSNAGPHDGGRKDYGPRRCSQRDDAEIGSG